MGCHLTVNIIQAGLEHVKSCSPYISVCRVDYDQEVKSSKLKVGKQLCSKHISMVPEITGLGILATDCCILLVL